MVLYFDALASVPGSSFGIPHLLPVVYRLITPSVVPFLLLMAWVLRLATATMVTLAMGPPYPCNSE